MTRIPDTPPLVILVVDDNEDDVLLLQESLRDQPAVHLLPAMRDGEEAMAYLRREGPFAGAPRPGLVLLDINMPRMNGFEVLHLMKVDPLLRAIPVVILTTSNREADILTAYTGGACSFVSKPVSYDRLKLMAGHFVRYWTTVVRIPVVEN
jgi:two-component system response regulator